MDINMPVMGGLESASCIIKHIEGLGKPKSDIMPFIVALTAANDSKEERNQCKQAGMQSFLIKPPALSDLKCVLAQVLG